MKEFYNRNLPHLQPVGGAFFVTFRLYGSMPREVVEQFKQVYEDKISNLQKTKSNRTKLRKEYFEAYEDVMHKPKNGPHYLAQRHIASIVKDELHLQDGDSYKLLAFSIMSNHVHIVIDTSIQLSEEVEEFEKSKENYMPLSSIMKSLKGRTAIKCNKALKRKGKFWARESFDVLIRNRKMLQNMVDYTINNSVKTGLVDDCKGHEFTYLVDSEV